VQPELIAGLFARSVDRGIPTKPAIALHVSPEITTRVELHWHYTHKHKCAGERSTRKSCKSLGQKGEQL
jgi:hypothetical protein